jgi:hypothetical protein
MARHGLSEPRNSAPSTPTRLARDPRHGTNNPPPSSPSLSVARHSPSVPVLSLPGEDPDVPLQGRTLRTRTVRQQHPYAFEYAHYKNSMRRAGLDDAIVKFQMVERQKALDDGRGRQKQVESEMDGFIVPEDEESQDLYVPPRTPPRAEGSRHVEPVSNPIDMEGLLAGFGGMISEDETPAESGRRKDKGKGKETATSKKVRRVPAPKPFPMDIAVSHA